MQRRMDDFCWSIYEMGVWCYHFEHSIFVFAQSQPPHRKLIIHFFFASGGKFLVDTIHLMKTTEKKTNYFVLYLIWYHFPWIMVHKFDFWNRRVFWIEKGKKIVIVQSQNPALYVVYTPKGRKTYIFDFRFGAHHFPFQLCMHINATSKMFEMFIAISVTKAIKKLLMISYFHGDHWLSH